MLHLFGVRLTPNRQKCCLLPWRVLQAAIYSPVGLRQPVLEPGGNQPGASQWGPTMNAVAAKSAAAARLDPEVYRPDFPILAQSVRPGVPLVYFDNAASSQRPREVIQAIVETYERHYANVHRGIHWLADQTTDLYETPGRASAASSTPRPRRRSSSPPARPRGSTWWPGVGATPTCAPGRRDPADRDGAPFQSRPLASTGRAERGPLRHVPLTDDGRLDLAAFDRLLGPRTRLVAVTAVSNVLGTINPVGEIIRRAHDAGALVLVDAAQSVPHQTTDVAGPGRRFPGL